MAKVSFLPYSTPGLVKGIDVVELAGICRHVLREHDQLAHRLFVDAINVTVAFGRPASVRRDLGRLLLGAKKIGHGFVFQIPHRIELRKRMLDRAEIAEFLHVPEQE